MNNLSKRVKRITSLLTLFALVVAMPQFLLAQEQPKAPAAPAAPAAAPAAQPAPSAPAQGDPATPAATPAAPAPGTQPAAQPAPQPPILSPEVLEPVERLARNVENAEKSLQELNQIEGELVRVRGDVERILSDSTTAADSLKPQLAEVEKQIERLGPPPAKDEAPEAAAIAAERARLNAAKASLDGAIKTAELAWVRAKQLIDRITVMRYQIFTRNLLERRDSPLSPSVWRGMQAQWPTIWTRFQYYGDDWLVWAKQAGLWLAALGAAIALVYGVLKLGTARYIAYRMARPTEPPKFFERVFRATWMAALRMAAPAAAVTMLYFGLASLELLFSPWVDLAWATFIGLLVYIAASAVLTVSFAPTYPAWRLIPVSDLTARRILRILKAFVAIYLVDSILVELARALYVPLSITVAHAFVVSTIFALLIAALVLTPFVPQVGPDRAVDGDEDVEVAPSVSLMSPLWIKLPLALTAVVILVSSLLGYIALGRFIAHQVVLSGTVIAACGLLFLAVKAATRGRADDRDLVGQTLQSRFGFADPARRRQLSWLIEAMATLVIAILALPLLMLQWGFSGDDIKDWLKALLFGFEIGQFRISLARLLVGIGIFTGLLLVTRMVQRWLRDNVLVPPRVDPGISNSIDTAVGYAGIGLALLVALSYGGLDITSLAIVAGALSVGIGFGLQSIVNNFVSGLILLVERPVKVGDWIVVGTEQGNVRRISVRSTEIETFDRASLIIPNSELITGRVLNWTHRSQLGRAIVKIQVAPTADPEQVMKLLLACAEDHPSALKVPAPFTSFDNFSGSDLQFTVGAVVADVYTAGRVASELRVAILKRFREEGIEFAKPQQDVHLKDLGWIKSAAARIAEQRTNGAGGRSSYAPSDSEA